MKYYDKSMYKTEQNVKVIVTMLVTFIIGFLIGYWCRGFENNKNIETNTIEESQTIQINEQML